MAGPLGGGARVSGAREFLGRLAGRGRLTRDGLLGLLADLAGVKEITPGEKAMIEGVLEVSRREVHEVMVQRSSMVVLRLDDSREKLLSTIISSGHSRFPVIGENRDEVVGSLLAKDVLRALTDSPEDTLEIKPLLRPVTLIPETKRLDALLDEFLRGRNHLAVVVDEYGGTAGLLTIEDVLEQIVGEIGDEHDPEQAPELVRQDDGRILVSAKMRIEEFDEEIGSELDTGEFDTVGGLVIHRLGRLPRRGDSVEAGGWRFEVVSADRRRVKRLRVSRV
ncbi:MAG: CBS domain-containing protein [Gammaproteobacteria bacterium]|nr:CBS domain-containing protein [Gammaproteobacteria bacterium]